VQRCFKAGINYFDSGGDHSSTEEEVQLGHALKSLDVPRKDYVVSTKIFGTRLGSPNDWGLSRKHIIEGAKSSIKQLDCKYVDVVFATRPDYDTPLEE